MMNDNIHLSVSYAQDVDVKRDKNIMLHMIMQIKKIDQIYMQITEKQTS